MMEKCECGSELSVYTQFCTNCGLENESYFNYDSVELMYDESNTKKLSQSVTFVHKPIEPKVIRSKFTKWQFRTSDERCFIEALNSAKYFLSETLVSVFAGDCVTMKKKLKSYRNLFVIDLMKEIYEILYCDRIKYSKTKYYYLANQYENLSEQINRNCIRRLEKVYSLDDVRLISQFADSIKLSKPFSTKLLIAIRVLRELRQIDESVNYCESYELLEKNHCISTHIKPIAERMITKIYETFPILKQIQFCVMGVN